MPEDLNCPICERNASRTALSGTARLDNLEVDCSFLSQIQCPLCGVFVLNRRDEVNLRSPRLRYWNPHHVSALLREQCIADLPPFWLRDHEEQYAPVRIDAATIITLRELLTHWPQTVPERLDRCLCNLARELKRGGRMKVFPQGPEQRGIADTSALFAEDPAEAHYHIHALKRQGYVEEQLANGVGVTLSPEGWARVAELIAGTASRANPAFVAMWFGGECEIQAMQGLYDAGIKPGIEDAGYKALRIDLVEHNEYIMDEVLGNIRRAPFVVADFTQHRNGVYFEAGFARGLGIPVIHTCREDCFGKAHFDTQQLNHIVWKTPDELQHRLCNRILGTIGVGPNPPARTSMPSRTS